VLLKSRAEYKGVGDEVRGCEKAGRVAALIFRGSYY
jgi:hypothetical protein